MPDRYDEGMATRRAVLGNAHFVRAEAAKTTFDADFLRFVTEAACGSVWSRPGLTPRERVLLAALGHSDQVAMHVRASANTGATPEDIREALLHVAVYAGVQAANHPFKIARDTLAAEGRLPPALPA